MKTGLCKRDYAEPFLSWSTRLMADSIRTSCIKKNTVTSEGKY